MVKDILASHEERMKKSIEALKHEFASLRAVGYLYLADAKFEN